MHCLVIAGQLFIRAHWRANDDHHGVSLSHVHRAHYIYYCCGGQFDQPARSIKLILCAWLILPRSCSIPAYLFSIHFYESNNKTMANKYFQHSYCFIIYRIYNVPLAFNLLAFLKVHSPNLFWMACTRKRSRLYNSVCVWLSASMHVRCTRDQDREVPVFFALSHHALHILE